MRITYINDNKQPMSVQVQPHFVFDPANPQIEPNNQFFRVEPQRGLSFELEIPEGHELYVKTWEGKVFYSTMVNNTTQVWESSKT